MAELDSIAEHGMEVDSLDVGILKETIERKVTRGDISNTFEISRHKARSRLEQLSDEGLIDTTTRCMSCSQEIDECECGKYRKTIYYHRDGDEEEKKMLQEFETVLENLNGLIASKD